MDNERVTSAKLHKTKWTTRELGVQESVYIFECLKKGVCVLEHLPPPAETTSLVLTVHLHTLTNMVNTHRHTQFHHILTASQEIRHIAS